MEAKYNFPSAFDSALTSEVHSGSKEAFGFSMKEVIRFASSVFKIPNSGASLAVTGKVAIEIAAPLFRVL